jgi:hypothetical protein
MKISFLFVTLFALSLSNCAAQASLITISNTQKGNTGHRGIIPKFEENESSEAAKPVEGKEYYSFSLTINQDCTLEISNLTVKSEGGQVTLKPKFDDDNTKKQFKKGEIVYLRVEKDKGMKVAKPTISGEGNLAIKINGRLKRIPIKEFTMVFPM